MTINSGKKLLWKSVLLNVLHLNLFIFPKLQQPILKVRYDISLTYKHNISIPLIFRANTRFLSIKITLRHRTYFYAYKLKENTK